MAYENEATGDTPADQSFLTKKPVSIRPVPRPSTPKIIEDYNEFKRIQRLRRIGKISPEEARVATKEENIRIDRLYKNLANADMDVKITTARKCGFKGLVSDKVLKVERRKRVKERQARKNVKVKKRGDRSNLRKALGVTFYNMEKTLQKMGLLGKERNYNKRREARVAKWKRMGSMRRKEKNDLNDELQEIKQKADDQKNQTMEKLTALKNRKGKEKTFLKRKLEEKLEKIRNDSEKQQKKHVAKMLRNNKKWTKTMKELADEASLLSKLEREYHVLRWVFNRFEDIHGKKPMQWPPEEGTFEKIKMERTERLMKKRRRNKRCSCVKCVGKT